MSRYGDDEWERDLYLVPDRVLADDDLPSKEAQKESLRKVKAILCGQPKEAA